VTDEKSKRGSKPGQRSAGRPRELIDPVRFLVSLERQQLDELEELAQDREQSVASLVREALVALLKRRRR